MKIDIEVKVVAAAAAEVVVAAAQVDRIGHTGIEATLPDQAYMINQVGDERIIHKQNYYYQISLSITLRVRLLVRYWYCVYQCMVSIIIS